MADIVQNSTMKILMGNSGTGSAFVWDDKYIVTAAHCVDRGDVITLVVLGEKFKAEVVGYSHRNGTDVGVIRIPLALRGHLEAIQRDNSPLDYLDPIVLVGCPLGTPNSVTMGVVSHPKIVLDPSIADNWPIFAKIDAAANPGNSGGVALRNGKAVGMLVRGAPHGMGMAWIVRMEVVEHAVNKILAKEK
jgi:S1-C subfamily serine protease